MAGTARRSPMVYFLVIETLCAHTYEQEDGTWYEVEEIESIRGLVEAKDVNDAEQMLRLDPPTKDGRYPLINERSFLRLRRIERLQWLAHPGVKAE